MAKRHVEMVFDMKWHVGDWPGRSLAYKAEDDGSIRNQIKHIAQKAAWNACQNDGFCLVQCRDGIVTIIAGDNPNEIDTDTHPADTPSAKSRAATRRERKAAPPAKSGPNGIGAQEKDEGVK